MFRMTGPAVPGAKWAILLGLIAAVIAGLAIAANDRAAAAWASAALFGVGLWLVWPQPARRS